MEMISEIKRDLVEMWQPISTYSMQNKIIEWDKDYETKEITNYSFCLSDLDNIYEIKIVAKIFCIQLDAIFFLI